MATQDTSREAIPRARKQINNVSPLLKLFGPDPVDPLGSVRPLRDIRDKIYDFAWSRDRRDDYKLDWVVSQWGFNRNVPERYIPDTPYGTAAFERLDGLPCNLHLVNKQISEDFTRFIYTANDLEIDVDLKAVHTEQGEAQLQKIVAILQNPNFQKFTQTARVRIHFPTQYPVNNLPSFNHRALIGIAGSLDEFEQLAHLAVRIVPMQGQFLDYELRVAAFPFYPMRMTNWSIRTLNDTTFPYTWDILDGQQARLLDKAWDLFQETGSLTASVHTSATLQQLSSAESAPGDTVANKNGSQKRKHRKMKAARDTPSYGAPDITDISTTSSETMQPRPGTPLNVQSRGAEVAGAQATVEEVVGVVTAVDADAVAETDARVMGPEIHVVESFSSSTPRTPTQEDGTTSTSSSSGRFTRILTPASSSEGTGVYVDVTNNVGTTGYGIEEPRDSRPPSPASSSVTFDKLSDAQDEPKGCSENDGQDSVITHEQKQVKRRKNGKKANKFRTTKPAEAQSATDSIDHANTQDQLMMLGPSNNAMKPNSSDHDDQASSPPLNLANYELQVVSGHPNYVYYEDPETGNINLLHRGAQVDRYLRQQERRRADAPKREAEQKQARDKRHLRKAKQLLLRRANVAADSPLSRVMEPRRESSKKKVSVQDRKSDTPTDMVPSGHIWDILTQVNKMRKLVHDSSADCPNEPEQKYFQGLKRENEDDQEIDDATQDCIEDWVRSCPSDDDSGAERHYMHEENEMYQLAREFSAQSLASSGDEDGSSRPYNIDDRFSQLQEEFSPGSPRSTDVEPYDSQDLGSSASGQTESDSVHGMADAENMIAQHSHTDQIDYPELDGRAGAPATARPSHNSDSQSLHPVQLLPCPVPFSHVGSQKKKPSAQDARRGRRGPGALFPGSLVQDASNNEARGNWAAVVQANDEALQDERRKQLARLEREMKADGTDYSHYAGPIKDHWTKTDYDGKCVGETTEQVIYGTQLHVSSSLGSLVATKGAQDPQEPEAAMSKGEGSPSLIKSPQCSGI